MVDGVRLGTVATTVRIPELRQLLSPPCGEAFQLTRVLLKPSVGKSSIWLICPAAVEG